MVLLLLLSMSLSKPLFFVVEFLLKSCLDRNDDFKKNPVLVTFDSVSMLANTTVISFSDRIDNKLK